MRDINVVTANPFFSLKWLNSHRFQDKGETTMFLLRLKSRKKTQAPLASMQRGRKCASWAIAFHAWTSGRRPGFHTWIAAGMGDTSRNPELVTVRSTSLPPERGENHPDFNSASFRPIRHWLFRFSGVTFTTDTISGIHFLLRRENNMRTTIQSNICNQSYHCWT